VKADVGCRNEDDMTREKIGFIVSGVCLTVALLWWAEILYRFWLFCTDYEMKLFTNHVGDGYFSFVHLVLGCFIVAGIASSILLGHGKRFHAFAGIFPMVLGILAWVSVLIMHRTGILIGYIEMMARIKGIQP
jgi:hypothetical protein